MVSEVQFCTTERPQLFEFEVATCRTCRLRSKKAILKVATSNLQKWRGFAQSWGPCMPIWHTLMFRVGANNNPYFRKDTAKRRWRNPRKISSVQFEHWFLCQRKQGMYRVQSSRSKRCRSLKMKIQNGQPLGKVKIKLVQSGIKFPLVCKQLHSHFYT